MYSIQDVMVEVTQKINVAPLWSYGKYDAKNNMKDIIGNFNTY